MSRQNERVVMLAVVVAVGIAWAVARTAGQGPADSVRRTADGLPDLTGVWQAVNTAAWNLEAHTARLGVPAGESVVDGGTIPYRPEALEQRAANAMAAMGDPITTLTADPISKCYLPGVPRVTYMPYPLQIAQSPTRVSIAYEFARASRQVYLDRPHIEGRLYNWMGDSTGQWEGDTLVVDVVDFNDQTWFDAAGNFHSDELHVVERYTPIDANHLQYEATIDDPKVFTQPWTISMPLYRRLEAGAQSLEYMCLEYKEPQLYAAIAAATKK